MHMSLSGMDYYGADIGGFHRNLDGDLNEMYTRWFAYGMLFDVPFLPHVENLFNCKETAPDRIGDRNGNLANARLRYEFLPQLYSLAAPGQPLCRTGNAAGGILLSGGYQCPPSGHEKLIGREFRCRRFRPSSARTNWMFICRRAAGSTGIPTRNSTVRRV